MLKLTEMVGAENLPKKKNIDICGNCGADYGIHMGDSERCPLGGYENPTGKQLWHSTNKFRNNNAIHNLAVTQLEGLAVGVDVEQIAVILWQKTLESRRTPWNKVDDKIKKIYLNDAQALAQSSAEWLRLERVE